MSQDHIANSLREKTKKSVEERKFEEFYLPDDFYSEGEEEDIETCDYDLDSGEGCVEPSLKHIGNCFECWLYQQALESEGN